MTKATVPWRKLIGDSVIAVRWKSGSPSELTGVVFASGRVLELSAVEGVVSPWAGIYSELPAPEVVAELLEPPEGWSGATLAWEDQEIVTDEETETA